MEKMTTLQYKDGKVTQMKYLYIVEHWVPFPSSEYGGVWNVIAQSDEECYDLIVEDDGEFNTQYYPKLHENIMKASKYGLVDELESKVVDSFLT
jgi:hypothetical protein